MFVRNNFDRKILQILFLPKTLDPHEITTVADLRLSRSLSSHLYLSSRLSLSSHMSHKTRSFRQHTRERFESTHGSVSRRLSLRLSLAPSARLSFIISLSLVGAIFLFSLTMTTSTRPVGSLCTNGPDLPEVQEVGLGLHYGFNCFKKKYIRTKLQLLRI